MRCGGSKTVCRSASLTGTEGWSRFLWLLSLRQAKKVTAAPHRGNTNKPEAKSGCPKNRSKQQTAPRSIKRKPKMLEVENLNQYYGGSHILRNVKLTVPDGKLTVLL